MSSTARTSKAKKIIKEFLQNYKPELLKEDMWQDLVYLMGSPDFNHSTCTHKIKALERHNDLCHLIDAIFEVKELR